jgi:hypothetical protein
MQRVLFAHMSLKRSTMWEINFESVGILSRQAENANSVKRGDQYWEITFIETIPSNNILMAYCFHKMHRLFRGKCRDRCVPLIIRLVKQERYLIVLQNC